MTIDVAAPHPLRVAAAEIAALARTLPRWDPFDPDGWEAFQASRAAAERALAARLLRMPGGIVTASPDGWEVELTLAGITARSGDRLQGACIAWAAAVRASVAGPVAAGAPLSAA
jgi:hypothetical protein